MTKLPLLALLLLLAGVTLAGEPSSEPVNPTLDPVICCNGSPGNCVTCPLR